jgi:HSP20 family molecular chaperone IbpA
MRRPPYLDELQKIHDRVEALFASVLAEGEEPVPRGFVGVAIAADDRGTWSPAVDFCETPEAYFLVAELPGIERADVALEVAERKVVLSGVRRAPEGATYLRMERGSGPFRRIFELGSPVDAAAVEAKFERGVLTARLPRRASGRASEGSAGRAKSPSRGAGRVNVRKGN